MNRNAGLHNAVLGRRMFAQGGNVRQDNSAAFFRKYPWLTSDALRKVWNSIIPTVTREQDIVPSVDAALAEIQSRGQAVIDSVTGTSSAIGQAIANPGLTGPNTGPPGGPMRMGVQQPGPWLKNVQDYVRGQLGQQEPIFGAQDRATAAGRAARAARPITNRLSGLASEIQTEKDRFNRKISRPLSRLGRSAQGLLERPELREPLINLIPPSEPRRARAPIDWSKINQDSFSSLAKQYLPFDGRTGPADAVHHQGRYTQKDQDLPYFGLGRIGKGISALLKPTESTVRQGSPSQAERSAQLAEANNMVAQDAIWAKERDARIAEANNMVAQDAIRAKERDAQLAEPDPYGTNTPGFPPIEALTANATDTNVKVPLTANAEGPAVVAAEKNDPKQVVVTKPNISATNNSLEEVLNEGVRAAAKDIVPWVDPPGKVPTVLEDEREKADATFKERLTSANKRFTDPTVEDVLKISEDAERTGGSIWDSISPAVMLEVGSSLMADPGTHSFSGGISALGRSLKQGAAVRRSELAAAAKKESEQATLSQKERISKREVNAQLQSAELSAALRANLGAYEATLSHITARELSQFNTFNVRTKAFVEMTKSNAALRRSVIEGVREAYVRVKVAEIGGDATKDVARIRAKMNDKILLAHMHNTHNGTQEKLFDRGPIIGSSDLAAASGSARMWASKRTVSSGKPAQTAIVSALDDSFAATRKTGVDKKGARLGLLNSWRTTLVEGRMPSVLGRQFYTEYNYASHKSRAGMVGAIDALIKKIVAKKNPGQR